MRPILPVLLILVAAGAVFLFVILPQDPAPDLGDDHLSAGEPAEDPGGAGGSDAPPMIEASGAAIADEIPPGMWEPPESPELSTLEDVEVLEIRIQIPEGKEKMTGDLVLRSLARALGADRPFHFADAGALAYFREQEFEGLPPGHASVGELLALCPRAGFRFFERDGRFYMLRLPDDGE